MVFYEINAEIQNGTELLSEDKEYSGRRDANMLFHMPTQKVFTQSKRQCCIFIYRFKEGATSAVIGAFGSSCTDVEKNLPHFLDCAGIRAGTLAWEETTISAMRDMLRRSNREGFIEDDDIYLDPFRLDEFTRSAPRYFNYAESIQSVCDCLRNHRNRVLTVLSLPRTGDKCLSLLRDKLGNIPVVELQEDMLFGERSSRFLRRVAKENGVTAPRSLMKELDDPEKGWLPRDIRGTFDRWFTNYLRENVYPQYACIETATEEVAKEKPVGSAYSELESMIGLTSAKDVIQKALDYYKAQKVFADRGLNMGAPSLHMVFTGNPGTAKTTVARLFARIMKENGVLSHGNLHEVGRGDLVGKYVGWTAKTVQRKFREAKGSVLFIDEAYSLLDGHENSFGDEAINTIVQEMENCRGETVVIFAGYPKPMEEFLERNPGLRSRIAFQVPFKDYDEKELLSIAEMLAKAKGLRFGDGVREKLLPIIRENISAPDFGNGRFARNLVEKAAMCQASRLARGDVAHVTDRELTTLLPEDFVRSPVPTKPKPRAIGFSV